MITTDRRELLHSRPQSPALAFEISDPGYPDSHHAQAEPLQAVTTAAAVAKLKPSMATLPNPGHITVSGLTGTAQFASAAGVDRNPAWYWNLIANPDAGMEIGDEHLDVNAVELSGAECDEKYADQANGILNTRSTSARRLAPSPWWPSSPSRPKPDDLAQFPPWLTTRIPKRS